MNDRTALVLGATGGIGRPVAEGLAAHGWTVHALHRDPASLAKDALFEWRKGDALSPVDVAQAAKGASIIVHAVKPRAYRDWEKFVLPMIDNTLAAADGRRVLIPGNVYNFGPDAGALIREDAPQNPITRKGRLRAEMERRIEAAVNDGRAEATILRAGDFFGPGAGSSWFSQAMVRPGKRPKAVYTLGKPGVGHQWVYLPDLAETFVRLAELEGQPKFARFHMDGHWDANGSQMAAAIARALGAPDVPVRTLPWLLLQLAAPFSRDIRELTELKYLWDRPVRLSNQGLLRALGTEPHTPLDKAVRQTLIAMRVAGQ
ncbi:NAD-dependent epimerase/dehydratase family protein [Agrobacterium leguminum]|uniref:NAD-dependent epimerase/dehydratase family protein n=1 Tax=Agrobacterium leguminum TaxID=2792015 RepID=UPI003CE4D8F0